jgi:hypothetical protein
MLNKCFPLEVVSKALEVNYPEWQKIREERDSTKNS